MQNPRLASRYAKSLVDLAQEQNQLEAIVSDMKYLQEVCKQSKDFTNVLRSPVIKGEAKEKIVAEVVSKNVGQLASAFIHLLIKKSRESSLPEIADSVIEQYNDIKGIHKVKLTTAVAPGEELKSAIISKVKADTGLQNIELESEVNEAIIGGFQLEYKGNLVDASILRDLRDIQTQFRQNVYVKNIR